jgi:succinoglycan biosynthesis transport protein ExoP
MDELIARRDIPRGVAPWRGVPAADPREDEGHLREVLPRLWRRRWWVAATTVAVVVPVAVWTALTVPLYRATTLLAIDPDPIQVFPYREFDRPSIATQFDMFLKGQDQLLRGASLRERVAARLASEPDPRTAREAVALGRRLEVQGIENTYMFRVGYSAPSPDSAARVANLFTEEFIKQHFETRQQTRQKARELLQNELQQLEVRVQQSEKGLVAYAQNNRLSVNERDQSPARAQLGEIALQRTQVEAEVFSARAKLDALQGTSADKYPDALVTDAIASLTNGLLRMESDLGILTGSFGPNWPAVVTKRQEIALTQDQLAREKRTALAQAQQQAQLDLSAAEGKRALVSQRLAEQQQLVNQLDNATVQYNIIRREVDTNQKMYDGVLERFRQSSVTSGMDFGGIQVVEPARPPQAVDTPKVPWNIGLATLVGLALGVCLVVGRDYWDTSVTTVEELARLTHAPVLGTIPLFEPARKTRRLWRGGRDRRLLSGAGAGAMSGPVSRFDSDSPAVEAVRNVCTSILLSRSERPPRVIIVTSAMSGEGKTTLSRELALAFGERGAKTVLVECDLRRPRFRESFDLPDGGGLTPWLAGAVSKLPTVHVLEGGLAVVAAGPRAPNPVRLLHSERMRDFVRVLLANYRFVVLDASPALGVADARVLAALADGAVVVARSGVSPAPALRSVTAALDSAGVQVLGTVLNGTDPRSVTGYLSRDYYV